MTEKNWRVRDLHIGEVTEKEKVKIEFESTKELDIEEIHASCGCTNATYHKEEKKLKVNFTPNKIPHHIRPQGYQNTSKLITIRYEDGGVEVLSFGATIKPK